MPAVITETEVGDVIVTEEVEELFCGGCGDQVATLTLGQGPCCHNLPDPWHQGRDGLYNSTVEVPREDEDEEEQESYPHCVHCGCTEWIVSATQHVTSDVEDGGTIFYDIYDFEYTARCASCDTAARDYNLEST